MRWLLRPLIERAGDRMLEPRPLQRFLFTALARRYDPVIVPGFRGSVVYELRSRDRSSWWTLDVWGSRAVASFGAPADLGAAAVVIHLPVSDFVRIACGAIDPALPLLRGRGTVQGELGLAARLPEMFGAPAPS